MSYISCKLCGYVFDEEDIEGSIEAHIQEKHFLGYRDYYEVITTGTPYIDCWKCGSPRYAISPYLSGAYLPCYCCVNPGNKQSSQEIKSDFYSKIKEYQGKILKSRYYQYILSLTQSQRENLLPKNIEIQSENLLSLKRRTENRIEKSSIFQVTNTLGRSSEISSRNLDALGMKVSDLKVSESSSGMWKIGETGFYVSLPEVIQFDSKHHSRGSILNPAAKRTTRRLRLSESGECIKFWNVSNLIPKTILFLSNGLGELVSFQDLPEETKWKIKFGILKTKPLLTRIFEIYNELLKYVIFLEDSVFLLNSIDIPLSQGTSGFTLTWSWEEYPWEETKEDTNIKLSIL